MKITEQEIVKERPIVKALLMKENLFDQVQMVPGGWQEVQEMTDEDKGWIYGWAQFYPKGATHRASYIIFLKDGKLWRTGLFTDEVWKRVTDEWPQVFIT